MSFLHTYVVIRVSELCGLSFLSLHSVPVAAERFRASVAQFFLLSSKGE